eukprot:Rmarinus@m.16598
MNRPSDRLVFSSVILDDNEALLEVVEASYEYDGEKCNGLLYFCSKSWVFQPIDPLFDVVRITYADTEDLKQHLTPVSEGSLVHDDAILVFEIESTSHTYLSKRKPLRPCNRAARHVFRLPRLSCQGPKGRLSAKDPIVPLPADVVATPKLSTPAGQVLKKRSAGNAKKLLPDIPFSSKSHECSDDLQADHLHLDVRFLWVWTKRAMADIVMDVDGLQGFVQDWELRRYIADVQNIVLAREQSAKWLAEGDEILLATQAFRETPLDSYRCAVFVTREFLHIRRLCFDSTCDSVHFSSSGYEGGLVSESFGAAATCYHLPLCALSRAWGVPLPSGQDVGLECEFCSDFSILLYFHDEDECRAFRKCLEEHDVFGNHSEPNPHRESTPRSSPEPLRPGAGDFVIEQEPLLSAETSPPERPRRSLSRSRSEEFLDPSRRTSAELAADEFRQSPLSAQDDSAISASRRSTSEEPPVCRVRMTLSPPAKKPLVSKRLPPRSPFTKSDVFIDTQESVEQAQANWVNGTLSNLEYVMHLNYAGGRSMNNFALYPVVPWIITDMTSADLDLTKAASFRDLSKPIGALNERRLSEYRNRYEELDEAQRDGSSEMPPFLYSTHYSSSVYTEGFLVRSLPELSCRTQGGDFDRADRLFHSLQESWNSCLSNPSDVRELIPQFYGLGPFGASGQFLVNVHGIDLGVRQDGVPLSHVVLPPWAKNPASFVSIMRQAFESDYVSRTLHRWIDLVFGYKQSGSEAVSADNVYHPAQYLMSNRSSPRWDFERQIPALRKLSASAFHPVSDAVFDSDSECPDPVDPTDADDANGSRSPGKVPRAWRRTSGGSSGSARSWLKKSIQNARSLSWHRMHRGSGHGSATGLASRGSRRQSVVSMSSPESLHTDEFPQAEVWELQAREFGQCPRLLFLTPHVCKQDRGLRMDGTAGVGGVQRWQDVLDVVRGSVDAQVKAKKFTEEKMDLMKSVSHAQDRLCEVLLAQKQDRVQHETEVMELERDKHRLESSVKELTSRLSQGFAEKDLMIERLQREVIKWQLLYQSEGYRHLEMERMQETSIGDLAVRHKEQVAKMRTHYEKNVSSRLQTAVDAAEAQAARADERRCAAEHEVARLRQANAELSNTMKSAVTSYKRQIAALTRKVKGERNEG